MCVGSASHCPTSPVTHLGPTHSGSDQDVCYEEAVRTPFASKEGVVSMLQGNEEKTSDCGQD